MAATPVSWSSSVMERVSHEPLCQIHASNLKGILYGTATREQFLFILMELLHHLLIFLHTSESFSTVSVMHKELQPYSLLCLMFNASFCYLNSEICRITRRNIRQLRGVGNSQSTLFPSWYIVIYEACKQAHCLGRALASTTKAISPPKPP